jgi:hypothetical protein
MHQTVIQFQQQGTRSLLATALGFAAGICLRNIDAVEAVIAHSKVMAGGEP